MDNEASRKKTDEPEPDDIVNEGLPTEETNKIEDTEVTDISKEDQAPSEDVGSSSEQMVYRSKILHSFYMAKHLNFFYYNFYTCF